MAPAVPRELLISYGGFEVGGTTDRQIHDRVKIDRSQENTVLEFNFIIQKATEVDFGTEVNAVEAAFRKVRESCTVSQGAAILFSGNHSSYSAFDSNPHILKQEDMADTGRSRLYTVRIEFGMPADNTNTNGRRSSSVNVAYSPSRRRTVTISGVYTGLSGQDARAQYEASIDTYAAAVLTALTGTFELVEEPTAEDNIGISLLSFTRVYEEVIYPQGSVLDDPAIVRQSLLYTRHAMAPGDSQIGGSSTRRLILMTAQYDAWVDKDITTNLKSKWTSIKSHILTHAKDFLDGGTIILTDEVPTFDGPQNRISARLEMLVTTGSAILESEITVEDTRISGLVSVPVWDSSGNPYSRYLYQGPAQLQRFVSERRRYVKSAAPAAPFAKGALVDFYPLPKGDGFEAPSWFVVRDSERRSPKTIGLSGSGAQTLDVIDFVKDTLIEFYTGKVSRRTGTTSGDVGQPIV